MKNVQNHSFVRKS